MNTTNLHQIRAAFERGCDFYVVRVHAQTRSVPIQHPDIFWDRVRDQAPTAGGLEAAGKAAADILHTSDVDQITQTLRRAGIRVVQGHVELSPTLPGHLN